MTLHDKIKKLLKDKPHWGATRMASKFGTTAKTIRSTCTRHKIRLMTREELEALLDARSK